jgi:hypothetical protein
MRRIIAVMACGFTVAACSMPSLNFLNSAPRTEVLRFESEPRGAEVKTSSGQSCRTPCQLTIQAAPEMSAEFSLKGHQPQTVSLHSEGSQWGGSAHLVPNPVRAELQRSPVASAAEKRPKKKPAIAPADVSVASAAPAASPPASAAEPAPSNSIQVPASAPNFPSALTGGSVQ